MWFSLTVPAERYRCVFSFPYFNTMQSKVFDEVATTHTLPATPYGHMGILTTASQHALGCPVLSSSVSLSV